MVGVEGAERAAASGVTVRSGLGDIALDQHRTDTETDPTSEQWLALHHAFRRYCEASPWERLANEDVLVVNDPLGYFKGYCVALGDGGVAYGLGVYLGDRGLLNYLTTMTSEHEPDGAEVLERGLALTAVLGDREELGNRERKAMRDLGLRYRGRGRWPIFRSAIPGHWPWYVNADEARFLTIALDNVWDVAERMGRGMLDLYADRDPGEVLTRSLRGDAWRDESEVLRPPALPVEEHRVDTDRLRTIGGSASVGSAVWEVTASYIPTGVQDGRGTRPYLPTLVMVVEGSSGLILTVRMLGRVPTVAEKQEPVLELLEQVDRLPGAMVCDREDTAALLEPITGALGIGLYVGPTPALDLIKDDLLATVLR